MGKRLLNARFNIGQRRKGNRRTHGRKVGLVDLGDSVEAGVEMSGVFGEGGYAGQLQVVTVHGTTKARAQQASGHS